MHVVNTLRPPRPLVGVGHSFGGNAIVNVALINPRLFSAVVLLDPVISKWSSNAKGTIGASPAAASASRRDLWPSRDVAKKAFLRSPFYKAWDERVFESWVRHGLRDVPTQLYPEGQGVTLATTKHQEVFTYFRPSWDAYDDKGQTIVKPDLVPDLDPSLNERYYTFPVYRSEGASTLARLPHLRPGDDVRLRRDERFVDARAEGGEDEADGHGAGRERRRGERAGEGGHAARGGTPVSHGDPGDECQVDGGVDRQGAGRVEEGTGRV